MEMNLTGQPITAAEALQFGLVSKVVPDGELLDAAAKMASQIASMSRPVAIAAKEAVNAAFNTSLDQGLLFERRLFQATFALQDRREGMGAFSEKRSPAWKHQ
jgi:enoyl-CoA hydratase